MESARFTYPFQDLIPPVKAIERTMGYSPGEAPEPVTTIIGEVIGEVKTLNEAKAEYRILSNIGFDNEGKCLIIEGERFNVKPIIFNQIRKAEKIALFICTAGETIGRKSRQSMKSDDMLKGYIYDVVGSEIVEAATDRMQEEIRKEMAGEGRFITNRFSPGYCGWNVSEQHSLFRFFKDNFCGIHLTGSALMSPVKSVSGIIGIGKEVKFSQYHCTVCEDKNCLYRNRKR